MEYTSPFFKTAIQEFFYFYLFFAVVVFLNPICSFIVSGKHRRGEDTLVYRGLHIQIAGKGLSYGISWCCRFLLLPKNCCSQSKLLLLVKTKLYVNFYSYLYFLIFF
jgi:hypothetical protein